MARGSLCSGCGGCVAAAPGKIGLATEGRGVLRPVQTAALTGTEEATIAAICPGLGQDTRAAGRTDPALWGPYVSARTGWATDPGLRFEAASGGALTAILLHLMESGRVDAVIQVRADPAVPYANVTTVSETPAEVRAAVGSRYAPSAPLEDLAARLDEHRATGRRFALVGKPCDAAALRAWTRRDPELAAAFPVIVSFFCGGVPAHAGAQRVIRELGAEVPEVTAFRYRGMGWPGQATATLGDGRELSMSYHDSWGRVLSRELQHRCKICADGTGAEADIVCADAWESDAAGYPLFTEGEGTSLVMARTALGEEIVAAAEAAGRLGTGGFDMAALPAMQPGQRDRRQAVLARLAAQRLLGMPVPRYRGLHLWAAARQLSLRQNLRNFTGMFKRLHRLRTKGW